MALPPAYSKSGPLFSCDGCFNEPSNTSHYQQNRQHPLIISDAASVTQSNKTTRHPQRRMITGHGRKEMKATEDFLSAEFSKLSVQERSKALEDLHCVGEELQESPELIRKSLEEFDQTIKEGDYESYAKAFSQNPAYVQDPSFRLKFLRANLYNVRKSVQQMESLLYHKAKYFGEDKIARDITLGDLHDEDKELLCKSSLFHIQEGTDRNGRLIVYYFNRDLGQLKPETFIRAHYYLMLQILTPLPTVQIKGLVMVYYDVSKSDKKFAIPPISAMLTTVKDYRRSIPVRYTALHLCLKKGTQSLVSNNILMKIMLQMLPPSVRVRTRSHYGSDIEIQYSLRSYGIPPHSFPMDSDGNFRIDIGDKWFQQHISNDSIGSGDDAYADTASSQRPAAAVDNQGDPMAQAKEKLMSNSHTGRVQESLHQPTKNIASDDSDRNAQVPSVVAEQRDGISPNEPSPIQPLQQDVLLGKGGPLQEHVGNIHFRTFVHGFQDDYDQAPRNKRRKISTKVVQALKDRGVRFLERSEDGDWVESGLKQAEDKVGQLFRSRRKTQPKIS